MGFATNTSYFLCLEIINVHFFCSSKRNEPKKRAPEMTNFVHTYARYAGLNGATVWLKFRTISGLPSLRNLESSVTLWPNQLFPKSQPVICHLDKSKPYHPEMSIH